MSCHRVLGYCLAVLVLVGGAVFSYAPGMQGPFLFDDGFNLLQNPAVKITEISWNSLRDAALSKRDVGYPHRPIPRVTFALDYYASGKKFSRAVFKTTNLVIHILAGVMVFWLAHLLSRQLSPRADVNAGLWRWFPITVALIWTLHPLQLTSVLYIVQRMTSMAGLFVFCGLAVFVVGRQRHQQAKKFSLTLMALGIAIGTIIGGLCKENAVLTPLFAILIELAFFRGSPLGAAGRRGIFVFYGVLIGSMLMVALYVLISMPDLLTRIYGARNFTPWERLMTQPRVLSYYLGLMFFPNLREFSLFHDDFVLSTAVTSPWTTAPALLFLALAVVFALRGIWRRSVLAFVLGWFLVGHLVESTFIGLEIVHEHRNYVPSFGIFFGATYLAFRIAESKTDLKRTVLVLGVVFIGVLVFVTHERAAVWSSLDNMTYFMSRNHPGSYRAKMERGTVLERQGADVREIYAAYRSGALVSAQSIGAFIRMQRIVSGLIFNIDADKLEAESFDEPREVTLLKGELLFDLTYLRRLDQIIADEITRRIRTFRMNAEVMASLLELQRCVINRVDSCPPVARIEAWFELALAGEHLQPIQKAGLLLPMARLRAYRGDIDRAVAMVDEAYALVPKEVGFLIELAQLFRVLRDYDNAERTLERIQPLVEETGRRVMDYQRLRKYIDLERRQFEEERSAQDS